MTRSATSLAKLLTYSGTLPLAATVVLTWAPLFMVDGSHIALTYGAVILSFLAGIHWACYLFFTERCPRNLLITSNAVALISWLSLWESQPFMALSLQILGFLYMLILDFQLQRVGVIPRWFFNLRRNATVIAVVCLAIIAGQV